MRNERKPLLKLVAGVVLVVLVAVALVKLLMRSNANESSETEAQNIRFRDDNRYYYTNDYYGQQQRWQQRQQDLTSNQQTWTNYFFSQWNPWRQQPELVMTTTTTRTSQWTVPRPVQPQANPGNVFGNYDRDRTTGSAYWPQAPNTRHSQPYPLPTQPPRPQPPQQPYSRSHSHQQQQPHYSERFSPQTTRSPFREQHHEPNSDEGISFDSGAHVVEVHMFVSLKILEKHRLTRSNYKDYIYAIVMHADVYYRHPSLEERVSISLIEVELLDEARLNLNLPPSSPPLQDAYNAGFCKFQTKYFAERKERTGEERPDVAVYLHEKTVCSSPRVCGTMGTAALGGMCGINSNCIVITDKGLLTAMTFAHELGHSLNMTHDHFDECEELNRNPPPHKGFFMDPYSGYRKSVDWIWSPCSKHGFRSFLKNDFANCIRDAGRPNLLKNREWTQFPGKPYTPNDQCEMMYERGAKLCTARMMCTLIMCSLPSLRNSCVSHYFNMADGTVCEGNKFCYRGACIESLRTVDGGWGPWSPYGPCTRTCGGGVHVSMRRCDRPKPENNGRHCEGPEKRYRSCNTHPCPSNQPDFRAEQCHQFGSDWIPFYDREAICRLYCSKNRKTVISLLRKTVTDGTKCWADADKTDICVDGICRKAGCDNVINSDAKLDTCGVCNGHDQSCRVVRKQSRNKVHYGYTSMFTIPKGVSNIEIIVHGIKGRHYVALKDKTKFILNSDEGVSNYEKTVTYDGVVFEYKPTLTVQTLTKNKAIAHEISVGLVNRDNDADLVTDYSYFSVSRR